MLFLFNGILLSILSYLNIGVDVGYMGRESLLGNNSNIVGMVSVISILIIAHVILENPKNYSNWRYIFVIFIPLILQTMASTGSKGALIIFSISLFSYVLTLKKNFNIKLLIVVFGAVFFILAYQYILQNEVIASRWNTFLEEGNTTGRSERWVFAFQSFLDNPSFGVGETGLVTIGTTEFGGYDPHNVYLYVLASGGLVAFIPFSIFIFRLIRNSLKSTTVWKSSLPVILLLVMLLFWFKAGGGLNSKLVWAYFALIGFINRKYWSNRSFIVKE